MTRKCIESWFPTQVERVECSSVVEHSLMVQWVVRSIPHGGPTASGVTKAVVCAILSVIWCT